MDTTMNSPNPMPELAALLKQLRLSGLLESLAQRNREAIESKLAYTEFLALVIQDEVARRDQKKFASRVRRAGFRGEKTLEGFDFSKHPQLNQELIRDLATCRFIEEKVALLIAGPCGTGKSHIAQALAHCALTQLHYVLHTPHTTLLGTSHSARPLHPSEPLFQPLAKTLSHNLGLLAHTPLPSP